MACIDFTNMSRRDLFYYRLKATKAHERPSAQNNYFTTRFSAELSRKQPADWSPTKLARVWCEHHGPANYVAAECPGVYGKSAKAAVDPKADPNLRRKNPIGKAVITP